MDRQNKALTFFLVFLFSAGVGSAHPCKPSAPALSREGGTECRSWTSLLLLWRLRWCLLQFGFFASNRDHLHLVLCAPVVVGRPPTLSSAQASLLSFLIVFALGGWPSDANVEWK